MLANFGPENWFRVSGIGPGFYSFPHAATSDVIMDWSSNVILARPDDTLSRSLAFRPLHYG